MRLAYVGTLGSSYDLSVVFRALRRLKDSELKTLHFIVMGDGPKRSLFEKEAEGLPVVFTGKLAYTEMVWVLSRCDIAINPIVKGAAQSIINKHMDYAMAGLPVISTQESLEYRELLNEFSCGISCRCDNDVDVAKAIQKLVNNRQDRKEMGANHRKMAEKLFDRKFAYQKIVDVVVK